MEWQHLISKRRLGRQDVPGSPAASRTAFQRDYDRIVFASAFRRLQDKTQVFPLASGDYVRTRLTHSLEVSSVGRTLGTSVGHELLLRDPALASVVDPGELGSIVAAACLAHDIGNPPFGHAGEDAIRHWFRYDPEGREVINRLEHLDFCSDDFKKFEGNAQGFRLLTRLMHPENVGGMQLTCTTLATFTKYPQGSRGGRYKKYGFFAAERAFFEEVAAACGLAEDGPGAWRRHPLVYLVEAADDICYNLVDLEDGYRMKLLDHATVSGLMDGLREKPTDPAYLESKYGQHRDAQIQFMRSVAIGALIDACVAVFMAHHDAILDGSHDPKLGLTDLIPQKAAFDRIREVCRTEVYPNHEVVLIEAAGFNVLGQLVGLFHAAIEEVAQHGGDTRKVSPRSRAFFRLFPSAYLGGDNANPADLSYYERVLAVTDFVSSLTDRNAVALFKRLTGISLPGE